jgi:hypothetical protein
MSCPFELRFITILISKHFSAAGTAAALSFSALNGRGLTPFSSVNFNVVNVSGQLTFPLDFNIEIQAVLH